MLLFLARGTGALFADCLRGVSSCILNAMDIKEKSIFITGGAKGLGRTHALACSKEHAHVLFTYFEDEKKAKEVLQGCLDAGAASASAYELDVRNHEQITSLASDIQNEISKISWIINNAGVLFAGPLSDLTNDDIKNQIRTNLEGMIIMCKEFIPLVTDGVINIGSGAGFSAYADMSVYVASKWGVRGFTQSLALEHPELNIVTLNPGTTATAMSDFKGVPPEKVSEVLVKILKGDIVPDEHTDVNMWDFA